MKQPLSPIERHARKIDKICTRCRKSLPRDLFRKDSKGHPRPDCNLCHAATVAAWKRANPERNAAIIARWRAKRKASAKKAAGNVKPEETQRRENPRPN